MNNLYYKKEGKANAIYKGVEVYAVKIEGVPLEGFYEVESISNFYFLKDSNKLRIFNFIDSKSNPLITDFSLLGLVKISPRYNKGRKVKSEYRCPVNNLIVVDKIFKDINDQDGNLIALEAEFNWYSVDGSIGLTKTEFVKSFNKAEAKTELRKRRARQVDYLEAGAEGTPIEPYVNALIEHYDIQIQKYVTHGTNHWEVALNNESDQTILTYLTIEVPRLDDPNQTISIKNSILYQLTGVL